MKYSKHIFFITSLCSVIFLARWLSADYLSDMKTSLQQMQRTLLLIGERIRQIKQSTSQDAASQHKDVYDSATVRFGDTLSVGEQEYLINRKPKIYAALYHIYGETINEKQLPVISIVASGGGYRAMLGTIGFLLGMEKIGFLDAVTYVAALSGSTWAVLPWIATGLSLTELKKYIAQAITQDINDVHTKESRMISSMLFKKMMALSPVTSVDVYGGLLANRLLNFFGDSRQSVCLSDLAERVKTGEWVYPICTAIDARSAVAHNAPWFEFTPHEIGCQEFGVYIPTWAYGRKFKNGTSTNVRPEVTLGFQLGTYGSAFGVHVGYAWRVIEKTIENSSFKKFMDKMVKQNEGKRFFWANIHNFMAGIPGNPFENRMYLKLVDAGLAFNLPYPPVSGERSTRASDVLIFCNMSAGQAEVALMHCEEYARARNLPFPVIDYEGISQRTISIFKDESDRSIPIVIYMPRVSDHALFNQKKSDPAYQHYKNIEHFDFERCVEHGFCKTKNFKYTLHQSQQVMNQMEFNVVANKEKIIDAIRWAVEK